MGRETPRGIWLKHMVLQDEVLCIVPVIWNLARIMVAHDIRSSRDITCWIIQILTTLLCVFRFRNEAIHLASVDVVGSINDTMRSTMVQIVWVIIGLHALVCPGVRHAYSWYTILHGNAIRSRISSKVGVKRAILLHDDHNMLNLLNTTGLSCSCSCICSRSAARGQSAGG